MNPSTVGKQGDSLQPLPKGITGFDAPSEGVPVKHFTAACYAAALQMGATVRQVLAANEQASTNFHEALVSLPHQTEPVRVLCNAHHGVVAFAWPATFEGDLNLRFMDCPELVEAFGSDFLTLSARDACAAVSPGLVAQLEDTELKQLSYWKPARMGDIVFNYWD